MHKCKSAPTLKQILDSTVRLRSSDCRVWTGNCVTALGYVRKHINGRETYLHRYVKSLTDPNFSLHDTSIVCRHVCNNPRCLNPQHLLSGTQLDNVADRVLAGRTRQGDTHPVAKLTASKVLEIRKLLAAGELQKQEIAQLMGVVPSTLSALIKGTTWKHV